MRDRKRNRKRGRWQRREESEIKIDVGKRERHVGREKKKEQSIS